MDTPRPVVYDARQYTSVLEKFKRCSPYSAFPIATSSTGYSAQRMVDAPVGAVDGVAQSPCWTILYNECSVSGTRSLSQSHSLMRAG